MENERERIVEEMKVFWTDNAWRRRYISFGRWYNDKWFKYICKLLECEWIMETEQFDYTIQWLPREMLEDVLTLLQVVIHEHDGPFYQLCA